MALCLQQIPSTDAWWKTLPDPSNSSFPWTKVYTAWPQPIATFAESFVADLTCLSSYALCAYANCTVMPDSSIPMAKCGCVAVPPNKFPVGGSSAGILEKSYKDPSLALCGPKTKTFNCSAAENYNTAPFCSGMQPSVTSKGKARMYHELFDIISTFNPDAWPKNTTSNQGQPGTGATVCDNGGAFALCYSAGCTKKAAWNGMDTTCYCPIYYPKAGQRFTLPSNAPGFSCSGQSVNGKIVYVQNGA